MRKQAADGRSSTRNKTLSGSTPKSASRRSLCCRRTRKFWILPPGTRTSGSSTRSDEHTSELQSHLNLVCRLLLEKKKKAIGAPPLQLLETTLDALQCRQQPH